MDYSREAVKTTLIYYEGRQQPPGNRWKYYLFAYKRDFQQAPENSEPLRPHLRVQSSAGTMQIKTNQKTVVSMQATHDFIKPHSTIHITMKLADRPS